jgi:hypothetical protein
VEAGPLPGRVAAWGYNAYGQTNVPAGLSNVVAIAGGDMDSLALQNNGTVVAWGRYWNGSAEVPMTVPAGLSNAVAIAAGADHSLALRANGTVVAWGYNGSGQTNDPPRLRNVAAIAAGSAHSLALQNNGTVVAWGYNGSGQTNVPPGLSNVVAIAGGDMYSLALQDNGTVVAWGMYWNGSAEVPMTVPEGLSDVAAIAAGADHSLALQADGTVVAWGYNGSGQTNVPPGLSNVVAIAAGLDHSLALQADGTVVAWGYNGSGQTNIPAGLSNLVAIAGGYYHSLAITIGPQILSNPPPAISLAVGAGTNLSVAVWSPSSFGCQWSLNGLPIPGATATSLVISNFNFEQAGVYSVTVANSRFQTTAAASVVRLTNSPVVLVDGVDVGGGTNTPVHLPELIMSSTFSPSADIYYTLDGSEPDFTAMLYSDAFTLTNSATIRAIAYNSTYTNWAEAAAIYVQVWPTYQLLASASDGGSISLSPDPYDETNLYASDTLVTLTATPSNGWVFVSWTGDITDASNVTTVLMDQPWTVQAVFEELPTYPLQVSTEGGGSFSITPDPFSESNLYISNTVVTLTATPANGWVFVNWTGDSTDTTNVTTVLMDQPRTVQAVFGTSLNLFTNGSGQVRLSPPSGPYPFGSPVQLTALPSPGYYFFGWTNTVGGFANPLLFTVTDATPGITARFGPLKSNQVSLTVLPNANGTVEINPSQNVYTSGDSVTLTAVPAANYAFAGWGGDASGGLNPLTLSLDTSKLITASFILTPSFQSVVRTAGTLTFDYSTIPGREYQMQFKTNLLQANWSDLGPVTIATNGTMSGSDSTGPDRQRFYRVVLLP